MVHSKTDREKQKIISDRCQALIEVLLKEDDNKYCVDCDAKGPRWASWNLGVFLCIRCAGIHRNLGVHISKVKSVNLDAWTPEQVAYVQRTGNSRARAIYEANLPDDFRRPQTDTALESFIRAKYEHKKYIAQDYVDPGPPAPAFNIEEELKRIKEQKRSKVTGSVASNRMISVSELSPNPKPRPIDTSGLSSKTKQTTPGLVDLDIVAATEAVASEPGTSNNNNNNNNSVINTSSGSSAAVNNNSALDLLIGFEVDFSNKTTPPAQPETNPESTKKNLTKEAILSLYSNSSTRDPFGMNTFQN